MSFDLFVVSCVLAVVLAIVVPVLLHYRKVSGAYGKNADRRRTTAVVQSVEETNVHIDNNPEFLFELLVNLPDGTTRTVRTKRLMGINEPFAFQPGAIVEVSFGKDNLRDLYIEGAASTQERTFERADFSGHEEIARFAPYFDTLPEEARKALLRALEAQKAGGNSSFAEGHSSILGQYGSLTVLPVDAADEIRKLAELRDQGILTEEEFTEKKRQLLQI